MADYRSPLRDAEFVLRTLADIDGICALPAFASLDSDTVLGVLAENARFVDQEIAPTNRTGDLETSVYDPATRTVTTPTGFIDVYRQYVESGWGGVPFPEVYGGGGFPWLVGIVMQEFMSSANLAFSMAPLLTQGAIDLLMHHGSEEQKETYLTRMVTGEWTGTMNLTEPQAGSDVGAVRTKAVPNGDGTWSITGTKIYISFGEHDLTDNIVHLVLARTPDAPPGTKGISCFIVPKFLVNDDGSLGDRNDVYAVSIEHKMGIKASPTCVLAYGDNGGATGYLIGEENQGMRYMFTMMNNARLSVGLEGLSLAERAYQDAVQYANERRQGRAPGESGSDMSLIVDLPDVRRMLLTMRSTIDALRAIVYVTAANIDLSQHHPDDDARARAQDLVDLLIPVVKGYGTDMGIECTSLAIQIYGGMGYIEESGVPQHYRDARITAIYEGTNGIQAMDLVGRKLTLKGGAIVGAFLADTEALLARLDGAGDEFAGMRARLVAALDEVRGTIGWLMEHGVADVRDALAGATPFLRMFSLLVSARYIAESALAADAMARAGGSGFDADYLAERIVSARFFCDNMLPAVHGLAPAVTAGFGDLGRFRPQARA